MPPKAKGNAGETVVTIDNANTGGVASAGGLTSAVNAGEEVALASLTSEVVGPASDTIMRGEQVFDPRPIIVDRVDPCQITAESISVGRLNPDDIASAMPSWLHIDPITPVSVEFQTAFTTQFPKLTALLDRAVAKGETPTTLRINSHTDGFRRAGIRHPFGVTDYPLDHFDPAQIEIMLDEPTLTVELV